MTKNFIFLLFVFFILNGLISQPAHLAIDLDTVKAQKFDMGKMWTFENPPLDYFENTYDFRPSSEWLEKAQKGALKFGRGCSASFVSADGLIMTNHHCVRGNLPNLSQEGEDILKEGFFAEKAEDERKVPRLFVDQLLVIEDVTKEVMEAMEKENLDEEKIAKKQEIITQITERFSQQNPDLNYRVTSLYNGGKFSLYGYKRYSDIRLVFVADLWTAKHGGDYDNFTYPRYGLDCAFLRAYDENGEPVKSDWYFPWSQESIQEGQALFVVGNPGSTDRINTIAQIEYDRDFYYPLLVPTLQEMYDIQEAGVLKNQAEDTRQIAGLYSIGNTLKVFEGTYKALLDPILMARKKNFEKKFKTAIRSNSKLNAKYGHVWKEIEASRKEEAGFRKEMFAYTVSNYYSPEYLFIARQMVDVGKELLKPKDQQIDRVRKGEFAAIFSDLYPTDFDREYQNQLLAIWVKNLQNSIGKDHELVQTLIGNRSGQEAVDFLLSKSKITTKEDLIQLAESGANAIFKSGDPFIEFMLKTRDKYNEFRARSAELRGKDEINNQLLGEALYAVYGDAIPPDATGTLRLADGVVKKYDYNGTTAPYKTTFYGSLDRQQSFDGIFPYNLSDYWEHIPEAFELSTPLNFISTNDIIGGNSGSPMLNTKGEIVGLAFDGNIESLPSRYIYTTEANRTVSVSAEGMLEAIRDLYKATRLSEEIENGQMK